MSDQASRPSIPTFLRTAECQGTPIIRAVLASRAAHGSNVPSSQQPGQSANVSKQRAVFCERLVGLHAVLVERWSARAAFLLHFGILDPGPCGLRDTRPTALRCSILTPGS